MKKPQPAVLLIFCLGLLTACIAARGEPANVAGVETAFTPQPTDVPREQAAQAPIVPAPDDRFPLAQPLTEEEVQKLDDETARQVLLRDREEATAGSHFDNSILGPRLVPRLPASLTLNWVDVITTPAEQPLGGYLDIAATTQGQEEHDFLLMLLVDGRQVAFQLGSNAAPAHLLRLPAWKLRTFSFLLPEPLSVGYHELLFLIHDDPYNIYATRGVLEKARRDGRISFSTASQRPFPKPTAIRYCVFAGDGDQVTWGKVNWTTEPFEPQKTDLLSLPLLLSLTDDVNDPLMGQEPALVAGSDGPLYAFVYGDFPASNGLDEVTAALVAVLDDRQVRLNGQEALFFEIEAGERHRFPLQIEWPAGIRDGKVHSLYLGLSFGVGQDWRGRQEEEVKYFNWAYFADPIMVVPDRTLIEYISQATE